MTATDFVTREEFLREVDLINRRVQGLYNLADRMGYSVTVPAGASVPESTSDADAPDVRTAPVQTGDGSGVDYAAVAYGLTEIKNKVSRYLPAGSADSEYAGTVEWFVGCFVNDPSFNAAEFRRQAGV